MNYFLIPVFFLGSYLLGSIPFGYVITRLTKNKDIRQSGSGNIGASNVGRILGLEWGLLTAFLDILKPIIILAILKFYFLSESVQGHYILIITALFCILGHIFPLFLRFKGGKGIGVFIGTILVLLPLEGIIFLGLYVFVLLITGYFSLTSLITIALFPGIILIFKGLNEYTYPYLLFNLLLLIIALITHRDNIKRLCQGSENRFQIKKR